MGIQALLDTWSSPAPSENKVVVKNGRCSTKGYPIRGYPKTGGESMMYGGLCPPTPTRCGGHSPPYTFRIAS
jgi:hypothetical protein